MTKVEEAWCRFVDAVRNEEMESGDEPKEIDEVVTEMILRYPDGRD